MKAERDTHASLVPVYDEAVGVLLCTSVIATFATDIAERLGELSNFSYIYTIL